MQSVTGPAYIYAIDGPPSLQAPNGLLNLTGWIAGRSPNTERQIRLNLGSRGVFDCRTGESRPDVAKIHPDFSDAAHSGFRLETYVLPGFHIGTLEYRVIGENSWIPFHTVSVLVGLSPLFVRLECAMPSESVDNWQVHGWCFHPQSEIENVSIHFAHSHARLRHGMPRPDVAATFSLGSVLNSGFAGHLDIKPGRGPLQISVKLQNGAVLREDLVSAVEIPNHALLDATASANKIRARQIKFTSQAKPKVSIIIPIYNQLDLTLGCLESIVRHAGTTSFEVIIVDDNSSPLVAEALALVGGLRLYVNQQNQGFVFNCNRGANQALGDYLLFLNNDTEVTEGWMEALVGVFNHRPKAGAVGAKLVYPDGRLQEAGAIIGEDGSGWNYGRGDDPTRPEYNYLRQADYCSGACLLVPRQLFLDLGGFDARYRPAYYEDTDLAFSIRAAGKEVYYQPAARIIHFEGASSGTDVKTGVKQNQIVNREKFLAKWAHALTHASIDPSLIDVARDRHAPCRVLVIDACALTPDADSGSLRMFNLLLILARHGAKVTFAAENLQFYEPYSTQLRLEGVEHLGVPHVPNLEQYIEVCAYTFDVIVLSRKHVAQKFIDLVRRAAPHVRIVFDTVDLMYLRLERQARLEQSAELERQAEESKTVELALCAKADLVFVVSPVEADLLSSHVEAEKLVLISNIHSVFNRNMTFKGRNGLMFVGGFQHPPNVDAVKYFLDEILPLVVTRLPSIEVHIVGSNMPDSLRNRQDDCVHMHGFVPDLDELYSRVRLTIAPLRYGAGVKGKVNQSMAHGVPVVATSTATEGMHLIHGVDVLVANNAADFADSIIQLHENESLWSEIAAGGIENIESHFSFDAVEKKLIRALTPDLFNRCGADQPLRRRPAAPYFPGEKVSFGRTGNSQKYMRQGWAQPEEDSCWMVGTRAALDFKVPPGFIPTRATASVYPFLVPPGLKKQRLLVIAHDNSVAAEFVFNEEPALAELTWELTAAECKDTQLSLNFFCPESTSPSSLGISNDVRRLSFAFLGLTIC